MSNLTAQAEKKFLESIKATILDSSSFREDVADVVVEMVTQRQKKTVWYWVKLSGAVFGWIVGIFIALASVSDNVKSLLLMLLE